MKVLNALIPLGVVLAAVSGIAFHTDGKAPTTTNEVIIRPGENGCVVQAVEGDQIAEVREVVLPQLGLDSTEGATTAKVRKALIDRYGSRVTEDFTAMHYVWVWDARTHQWIIVCLSASEFTVDFGALGSVVVQSQDRQLVGDRVTAHSPSGS